VFRRDVDPMQLTMTIVGSGHFYCVNMRALSTIFGADLDTKRAREAHCVAVVPSTLRD
jgi:hypothetical protein